MQTRQTRRLIELTTRQLRCKHAISGNAPAVKMCAYCYECTTCPYDQMLEDMDEVARIRPRATQVVHVYEPTPRPLQVVPAVC
jgi:hypothetical protein